MPKDLDDTDLTKAEVWGRMAEFYGLREALDYAPISRGCIQKRATKIGLIYGEGEGPEKTWPVSFWRKLVGRILEANSEVRIVLYGGAEGRIFPQQVCEGFDAGRVSSRVGQTDLGELCDELSSCLVICGDNDSSMHLANMLGTPVVVLSSPTSRTHHEPVFEAARTTIELEACPDVGGMGMDRVDVERVCEAVLSSIKV